MIGMRLDDINNFWPGDYAQFIFDGGVPPAAAVSQKSNENILQSK